MNLGAETAIRTAPNQWQRRINILMVAAAFAALPPLLTRAGVLDELWALNFGMGGCYVGMALSLNLLMGYAGQISLGHGAFLGIGAFTTGIITTRADFDFFVALIVAAGVGGLFALVIGIPALRLRGLYLAIATIAFGFVTEMSLFRWQPVTRGSAGLELRRPNLFGFEFRENGDYLSVILIVVLLIWLLDVNVVRSKLGRAFHGIRESESVAQSYGVDVARYKLLAFVLSGALAAISGALYGHLIGFVNSLTFSYNTFSLPLVLIVVVGGLGSRPGVAIAGFFFAVISRLLKTIFGDAIVGWELIIGALLLIDIMARHPGGFAEVIREAREKKRARSAGDEEEVAQNRLPALPRPSGLPERGTAPADVPVLQVRGVSVAYGGLMAVSDVSLDVPRGQIVGLIGPNGAGKTSLFNAVSGFVPSQSGTVRLLGEEIQDLPSNERAMKGLGRTFQLIGLAKNLSVLENFLLAQHIVADYSVVPALAFLPSVARKEEELIQRSLEAINALGFERYVETPVKNLSHGQQRIVEIGCALATAPEVLLLDEPSAGMAPGVVENLALRLKELRDHLDRTVLLIEHNIPLVLDVCDYIYVLNFGQILAHGTTEEIAAHPDVIAAYFGEAETTVLPEPEAVHT